MRQNFDVSAQGKSKSLSEYSDVLLLDSFISLKFSGKVWKKTLEMLDVSISSYKI